MGFNVDSLKKRFRKETFNFDRPDINLYNFFPQLPVLLAINGIFFNKRNSLVRFVWPFLGTIGAIAGWVIQIISIWHYISIKDYVHTTECFYYSLLATAIPMVTISVNMNNDNIYNLLENMNKDFVLICGLGFKYRETFLKRQLQIWQLYTAWFMFSITLIIIYSMLPIMQLSYQCLLMQDEHTTRPLPFIVWLPHDDPYKTPNYEIMLLYQSFLCLFFVQTASVYIYTLFHILIHFYSILEIMILDLEGLFDGLEETVAMLPRSHKRRVEAQLVLDRRVSRIVNMHISVFTGVRTASSIYGIVLMYQIVISSPSICLIMFQILTKLEEGIVDLRFILSFTAIVVGLWIPCYLGTMLRNKAFDFGDACWNCGWHRTSLSRLVRSDLIIIIQRAQQPITIKFTGLPSVELETFSAEMSKAYTYLNMLRQYSAQK